MTIEEKKIDGFHEAKKHLVDAGFWPKDGKEKLPIFPKFFSHWFFVLGFFMVLGLLGHMYKSLESERIPELINDIFFLLVAIFVCLTSLMYYIKGNKSIQLLKEISQQDKFLTSGNRINSHVEKMTTVFYLYSVLSNAFFMILTYYSDNECFEMKKAGNEDGYICGVLYPAWYPLTLDHTPWKQMIHIMEFIEILYFVPKVACACIFFYGCIVFTEDRILNLKNFLKNIEVTQLNAQDVTDKLKYAARSYSDINRLVKEINSTIGIVFSPSQHILLGLIITLLEYQVVVEKKGTSIPTLLFWFLFESLTCWKGQSLENASVSLAEHVYEMPWYNMDPSAKSIYKIFYSQVQVTLQLKCPPMVIINFAFFYEVMKGSYSLLMYLQKLYG